MKNQKKIIITTSLVIFAGFVLAIFLYQNAQNKKYSFMAQENAEVFVRNYSPSMGPDDAKVYLIEYMDPECESCRMFYPSVKNIMKDYEGQIKLVIRYVPFHRNSQFVIAVLEASRKQSKFWEVLNTVFETQPIWGDHHNPQPEKLWEFIGKIDGLDIEKLRVDMKDSSIQEIIKQDIADARTLNIRQTPTFFVNGKKLQQFGVQPLIHLIESELKK